MGKGFGICCILLGICCLMASVGWIIFNHREEENAQNASQTLLQDVRENILDSAQEETGPAEPPAEETGPEASLPDEPAEIPVALAGEMPATQVNGYDCIGILSIPVLELELPVLTDWSYEKLKMAPCHYFGSYFEGNFVIAAHNYASHFGRLSALQPKDLVLFTDISGNVYCYEVVLSETLPGSATEEMIHSGFDLSLYTCTPGGANRVTVRCSTVHEQ